MIRTVGLVRFRPGDSDACYVRKSYGAHNNTCCNTANSKQRLHDCIGQADGRSCRPSLEALFSWHPTVMTFVCMLMIYEGIGLFSPKNGLLDGKSHETKRNTHSFVNLLGAYGIFWGFTIVTMAKFQHNITHFASLHSTLGACAGGFTLFQGLGGLATRFQKLSPVTPKNMKFGHALCGVFQYLFTCLAFITGISTDYMTIKTTPLIQIILISLPMIAFGTSSPRLLNRLLSMVLKPK
uniref:ascorbate ferrireductase (transmembrane) n=1 Tax=Strigamia maritima TaxID=126957 RepID=T1IL02_STRMM